MDFLHTDKTPPEIRHVRTIAQSRIFQIQALDLRFSNGQERVYERLTPARRPAVMVLPQDGDDLIMIREYCAGTERYELTCVKGLIDEGETPQAAANREMQEEIGYGAQQFTFMRVLYSSPGHMYSPMHVFIAQQLFPSRLMGDEPEPLETVRVPIAKLDHIIDHHDFGDARVLAALMLWQRHLQAA